MPRRQPQVPPENPNGNDFSRMMQNVFGEMEDDRSRRRNPRRRQPQEEEDDINIDCLVKKRPKHTFDDVAGNDEAKEELQEIARAIQSKEFYERFGAALPKGILMTGKPGCGKTYMTGALANALNAPFYHCITSQITSMWFGQSEKNLQKVFDHAKMYVSGEIDIDEEGNCTKFDPETYARDRETELLEGIADEIESEDGDFEGRQNRRVLSNRRRASEVRQQIRQEIEQRQTNIGERYAIVFFDEIDALGASRDNTPFQGGVSNRIVSTLLENMDGLESAGNIIVIASTNRPEAVDPALRRAGRFDRIIKVVKPDKKARKQMFEIHFGKAQEKASREFVTADFDKLAVETKGLVGADVAEIVRQSCQRQAKLYREAAEETRQSLDLIQTEGVLEVLKTYRTRLRDKNPYAPKGKIGFQAKKEAEPFVEEGDLDGGPEPETEE